MMDLFMRSGPGLALLLGTEVAFFFYGEYLLREILLRDYEIRSVTINVLFGLSFASTCALSEAVTLDIIEVLNDRDRRMFRNLNLYLTLLLITLVIPAYTIYLVFLKGKIQKKIKFEGKNRNNTGAWILTISSWVTYMLLFWFGLAKVNVNLKNSNDVTISSIIERVSIAGVFVMATLSGYGCVNVPYRSLPVFNRATEKEVKELKSNYIDLIDAIIETKTEVALIEFEAKINSSLPQLGNSTDDSLYRVSKPNIFKRFFEKIKGDGFNAILTDKERLKVKINEAEYISNSMKSTYLHLQEKIAQRATANIFFGRSQKKDSLSFTLDLISEKLKLDFNLALLSLRLSFIMVGIIISLNMRNMVLEFTRMLNSFNSTTSFEVTALIFAAILGSYLVSTLVMIQTSLPSKYRTIIQKTFGNIELIFYQDLFDIAYVSTASITALILYVCLFKLYRAIFTHPHADSLNLPKITRHTRKKQDLKKS